MKLAFATAVLALGVLAPTSASGGPGALESRAENFLGALNCTQQIGTDNGVKGPIEVAASFWIPRVAQAGVSDSIEQVWIDLSLFNNNFAPGTFIGSGPFAATNMTQQFDWMGLNPGRRHYYRLNALTPTGWSEIGRGAFDAPDCENNLQFLCGSTGAVQVSFQVHGAPSVATAGASAGHVDPVQQWIDLSLFDNGFARGTFIGTGPFPPQGVTPEGQSVFFNWDGLLSGRVHYFRVNALYTDGGWVPRASGSFLTPDCRGLPSPAPPPLT